MRNKDKYRIYAPNGIDGKLFVPINGQNQYIFIRGKDINNPVILNLHGGPANPDAFLTYEFVKEITDSFTFVSWDQRGCGRTYFENKKIDPENETAPSKKLIIMKKCGHSPQLDEPVLFAAELKKLLREI